MGFHDMPIKASRVPGYLGVLASHCPPNAPSRYTYLYGQQRAQQYMRPDLPSMQRVPCAYLLLRCGQQECRRPLGRPEWGPLGGRRARRRQRGRRRWLGRLVGRQARHQEALCLPLKHRAKVGDGGHLQRRREEGLCNQIRPIRYF
jgi:hypothetical protein